MQVSGNYDSTIKAGAVGAGVGAGLGAASSLLSQKYILKNPELMQDVIDFHKNGGLKSVAEEAEKVLANGKVNYKMAAKNAGKIGLLTGALCAAGNIIYKAVTNKDE